MDWDGWHWACLDGITWLWIRTFALTTSLLLSVLFCFFYSQKVRGVFLLVYRRRLKITFRYNFVWVRRVSLALVRLRRTLIGRAQ
jgi:hypothetical protein